MPRPNEVSVRLVGLGAKRFDSPGNAGKGRDQKKRLARIRDGTEGGGRLGKMQGKKGGEMEEGKVERSYTRATASRQAEKERRKARARRPRGREPAKRAFWGELGKAHNEHASRQQAAGRGQKEHIRFPPPNESTRWQQRGRCRQSPLPFYLYL